MTSESLPWLLILGSILPLAAGPFLAQWADRAAAAKSVVDAFTAVSLGGLVVLHIWPHAFLSAGVWTLVGGLLGLLLPFLLHGTLHAHERKIYPGFVLLAFLGLAVHAALDGVALFSPLAEEAVSASADHDPDHHGHGGALLLALAVILHRLPMGLAVWWFAVPILGRRFAIFLLTAIAGATVLGFSFAGQLLVDLSMPAIAVFEATIAGMLLHVVMGHDHGHAERPSQGTVPWASAVGTLVGVALVVGLFKIHPMEQRLTDALSFGETFTGMAFTLAPWLLLGLVIHVVGTVVVGSRLESVGSGDGLVATWWRRLGRRGRAELLPAAMLAFFCLMGGPWTLWRWLGILWILGLWLYGSGTRGGDLVNGSIAAGSRPEESPSEGVARPLSGWRRWLDPLLDQGHRWVIWSLLAVGLVALMEPMVRPSLAGWSPYLALLTAVGLGVVFYRNALHGGILAFFFQQSGWSPWLILAFLFAGSLVTIFSMKEGESSRRQHLSMFAAGAGASAVVLWALLSTAASGTFEVIRSFDGLVASEPCIWSRSSLAVLAALLLVALWRKGFRGLLHPIFDPAEAIEWGDESQHAESCDHSH